MRCVNKLLLILIFGIFLINVVSSAVNTQNTFARNSINQRAFDVATQLEIYLEVHSDMTLEDLKNDARFNELAVQQVGRTKLIKKLSISNIVLSDKISEFRQGYTLGAKK